MNKAMQDAGRVITQQDSDGYFNNDPFSLPIDFAAKIGTSLDQNQPNGELNQNPNQTQTQTQTQTQKPLIELNQVDFYWASFDKKPMQTPVLADINLQLFPGEILTIIGPSASGKTALLTGILGNLYPQKHKTFSGLDSIANVEVDPYPGQYSFNNSIEIIPKSLMDVDSNCGYAAQHPFLMNDTVRNNIILSSQYDAHKFQKVVEASALAPDLAILPNADLTIVSSESGLSGGQMARVAFARILYHADIIKVAILDDIFSAVDALVAKTMFFKGVCGMLKHCGVILALNSHYDFLQNTTRTIFLAPSNDQYWTILHTELTSRRLSYDEFYNEKRLELDKKNNKKGQDYDEFQDSEVSTSLPGRVVPGPRSPISFGASPRNEETDNVILGRQPSSSESDGQTGFRTPSSIIYVGDLAGLMQLDHPLIHSLTLAQKETTGGGGGGGGSGGDDNDDHQATVTNHSIGNNNGNITHVDGNDAKHQKWILKLKKDQETNAQLAKTVGLVTDEKTLKKTQEQLSQKIEGDDDASKKKSGPTQARVPARLYAHYFRGENSEFGMWVIVIGLVFISLLTQVFRTGLDVYLLEWAEDATNSITTGIPQSHTNTYWFVSSIIGVIIAFGLGLAQLAIFLYASISASHSVHRKTLKRILHSTLAYLDTTPMGTILNALTRDVFILDMQLPGGLIGVTQQLLGMAAVIVLSIWTSPIFLIPLIPAGALIVYLRQGFHNTSVQLRRIENSNAQPMHALFYGLSKGSAVLRAFPSFIKQDYINRFRDIVNKYLRSAVISMLIERRFAYYLNIISAFYIAFLAITVVILRDHLDTKIGLLSITYSLRLTGSLQITIRVLTGVTQSMTSLHRLENLQTQIPQEPSFHSDSIARDVIKTAQPEEFSQYQIEEERKHQIVVRNNTPPQYSIQADGKTVIDLHFRHNQQQALHYWPWKGKIEFRNVCLRYRDNLPIVLNKASFTLYPRTTYGVCGQTGAGKSTTLYALMRLINPDSGQIFIDGVDITQVGLGDLRSRLGFIPQSPTIFSGTIRSNLDPLSRYTDDELWVALGLVDMVDKVNQLEDGLYSAITENGGNLSSSHRQLLCIARSLLAQPNLNAIGNNNNKEQNNEHNNKSIFENKNDNNSPHQIAQNPTHIPPPTRPNSTSSGPQQGSILLADEITSSVSAETDALVQKTIRQAFGNSTILVIAHRLNTIIDLDRVLVLRPMNNELVSQGVSSVMEFDVPFLLLNDPDSAFFQMCMATGIDNFVLLWIKAREAFYITQKKELTYFGNFIREPVLDYDNLPDELVQILTNEHGNNGHLSLQYIGSDYGTV
jgi:ABC-type multidrug transport system fused ATPase/permease subunit